MTHQAWWQQLLHRTSAPRQSLLLALFPSKCASCHTPTPAVPRFGLCARCWEVLEPNTHTRCICCDLPTSGRRCPACCERPPPFDALRAPYLYGGPLADLVVAAKFRHREDLAVAVGNLIAHDDAARALTHGCQALVPVPLGRRRRRQRGYNQSAIMARTLGKHWRIPVQHALARQRETRPQSDLQREDRRANVKNAFVRQQRVAGRIALVDDIVTSGETARQAAKALLHAGAETIVVIAAARVEA